MQSFDEVKKLYPGWSDNDIISSIAKENNTSPEFIQGYFGYKAPTFGGEFKKAVPRSIGQTIQGVGQLASDAGWEDNPIERYGQGVVDRNPSGINSFADIGEHPAAAVGSAIGNALGFLGPQVGVGLVGKGLGALGAVRAGNVMRGFSGQTSLAGLPSYGGIRQQQEEGGNNSLEDKLVAGGGALAVGAIENLGGVQRLLGIGRLEKQGTVDLLKGFGKTPIRTAAKTALRAGLEEGAEELAQNPIEQLAAYQDPMTEKNLMDTGFSGAMGALGGLGIGAGIGAGRGMKHRAMANKLGGDGYLDGGSRSVGGPPDDGDVGPAALMRGLERREAYQPQADFDTPGAQPQPNPEAEAMIAEARAQQEQQALEDRKLTVKSALMSAGVSDVDAEKIATRNVYGKQKEVAAPQVLTERQQAAVAALGEGAKKKDIEAVIAATKPTTEEKVVEKDATEAERTAALTEEFTKRMDALKGFAGTSAFSVENFDKVQSALEAGNLKTVASRLPKMEMKAKEEALNAEKAAKREKENPTIKEEKKSATKTAEAKVPVLQEKAQPDAAVPTAPSPTANEGVKNGYVRERLHEGFVQTTKNESTQSAAVETSSPAKAASSVPVKEAKVKRPKVLKALPKDQATKDAEAFAPVEVRKEVVDGQEVEVKVYAPEATAKVKRPKALPKDQAAAAPEVPQVPFDKLEPADKKLVTAFMGYNDKGEVANKPLSFREVAKHVGGTSHMTVAKRLKELGWTAEFRKTEQEARAPATVEAVTAASTEAQIESDLAAEIAAGESQAATEKEKQKSGHLVDENGENLSDTETGMHEDTGEAIPEQGDMGGTADTGQGWKSLWKNKVPITDKRWTEPRLAALASDMYDNVEKYTAGDKNLLAAELAQRERNRVDALAKKIRDKTPAEKLEAQAKAKEANIVKAHELISEYNAANGTDLKWEDFGDKQQTRLENIGRKVSLPESDKQSITKDRALDEIGVNAEQISKGVKYSTAEGGVPNHTTSDKIFSVLNRLFFSPERLKKILKVYDTQADFEREFPEAAAELKKRGSGDARVAGMEYGGKVAMIAENITTDKIMGVFLHEVGVHLGMETLIGKDNLNWLSYRVIEWSKRDDNSNEAIAAKLAVVRANFSNTPDEHMKEELVAYMVQMLVERGVDPQAAGLTEGHQWFRRLWAAAKVALRKIGFKNPNMTGQELVDLAFGAAQIQLEGAWHGTAADFRKFDHAFMSSGEGAQAFGWGTYIAERVGIAKAYWDADVKRKGVGNLLSFGALSDLKQRPELEKFAAYIKEHAEDLTKKAEARGGMPARKNNVLNMFGIRATLKYDRNYHENFLYDVLHMAYWDGIHGVTADGIRNAVDDILSRKPAGPGSLMAASYNIRDNEWLKLDKAYTDQSPLVQEALKPVIKAISQKDPSFFVGHDPDRVSGNGVYNKLTEVMSSIRKMPPRETMMYKNNALVGFGVSHSDPKKAASLYLDSLGIKGNKFLDKLSRGAPKVTYTGEPDAEIPGIIYTMEVGHGAPFAVAKKALIHKLNVDIVSATKHNDEPRLYTLNHSLKRVMAAKESDYKVDDTPRTYNMVIFNHDNVVRVATKVGAQRDSVKFSELPPIAKATEQGSNVMFRELKDNAYENYKKGLVRMVFGHDLVKIAIKDGLKTAQGFFDLTLKKDAIRNRMTQDVERVMQQTTNLPDRALADKFLRDSTINKQWGFAPSWDKEAKVDAGMEARFNGLSKQSQEVVKSIFQHGHDTYESIRKELNDDLNNEYDRFIAEAKDDASKAKWEKSKAKAAKESAKLLPTLQGPYAPLKRFGDYAVILKSPEYLAAEDDKNVNLMNNLIADEKNLHHSVEFFDTKGAANTRALELQKFFPQSNVKSITKQSMYKSDAIPWQNIAKLKQAVNEAPDTKYKESLQRIVMDLYLRSVAETSARKAQLRRKGTTERAGVAGSADMFRAFAAHGQATAHYLAALQGNKEINQQISKMRGEAKALEKTGNSNNAVTALNEIMARYAQSIDYRPTPFVDKAMRVTSLWMLATSPAYYLQNAMQTFMLTLPVLGGKFGARSFPAVLKAYGDVARAVKNMTNEVDIDNLKISPAEKQLLKDMWEGGKLDIGINAEMGRWTRDGDHTPNVMDKAMRRIDKAMVQVELLNRTTAALAAYRLSGGDAKYAADIVDTTHGNYAGSNAPRFFHASGLTKLVTQFRKYQLIQASLLVGLTNQAFKGATAEEKSAGRLALSWLLAQQLMTTGVAGAIPTALLMAAGIAGGDDDKDWERNARKAIGDDNVSDFLLHGIPAGMGLDLSKKLGISNAFSVLPFADMPNDKASYEKALTAASGAFFGGIGPQAFSALKFMHDGEYYKGIETALPKGLRDAMKAYRFATVGVTSGRSDVLLSPDEISTFSAFAQAVGLPTTSISNFQRQRGDIIELSKHFTDKDHELKNDYAKAVRSRNSDALDDLREEWKAQQASKREWMAELQRQGFRDQKLLERLKPQPLSTLLKAPQDQAKREKPWASVAH